jgi:hypothetical protein
VNKTAYVITNERVIILGMTPFGQRMVRTFLPHQLNPVSRIQRKDGSGDLVLSNEGHVTTGFLGIPDVKNVEALVLALAGSSAKRADRRIFKCSEHVNRVFESAEPPFTII